MLDKIKEFKPTSWAIDNKTTTFILVVFLAFAGYLYYQKLPKESFPEVKVPTIYVTTIYAGTSPTDMENLVAKPLEKQIKGISGVKKVTSNSIQDFCNVVVEFNTDVEVAVALDKVKDAIDKAKRDLPDKLTAGPDAQEINFSEFPIMYVNVAGPDLKELKEHADDIKDRIESLKEITRVDMVGALDREIQVNVDMYALQARQLTLGDISRAIQYENMTISGGTVTTDGMKRTIAVKKEFKSKEEIESIVVGSQSGAIVYLKDVAHVDDTTKEKESFARLDNKDVVTLNIIKRPGENLVDASDEIYGIIAEMKESGEIPSDIIVTVTGDQSEQTRVTLHDLINTIIIGFILVLIVLMFFMGATNAFFVALSVPLSMALAFIVLDSIGYTMNMIVLFAFLLALGIVVDDAIVVIENTHRIFLENQGIGIVRAAKLAAGEVFLPVLSGTLTTLAPFVPLAFWDGIIGQFMVYLPVTLIITLTASLIVAYLFNPVFAVSFMRHYDPASAKNNTWPTWLKRFVIFATVFAVLCGYLPGNFFLANLTMLLVVVILLHHYVLRRAIFAFQLRIWPVVTERYKKILTWALSHRKYNIYSPFFWIPGIRLLFKKMFLPATMRAYRKRNKFVSRYIVFPITKRLIRAKMTRQWGVMWSMVGLFILSFVGIGIRGPKVEFFPTADPNFIYTYIELPVGTDQNRTNEVTMQVESRINTLIGNDSDIVTSVISNVAFGAGDPNQPDLSIQPHKAKVAVAFVAFANRNGKSTRDVLVRIKDSFEDNPLSGDVSIIVEQEQGGPPVGKPISIEITGENLEALTTVADQLKYHLDTLNITGVDKLKSDVVASKPEIVFDIDRERANREGISTGQIGMEIRGAVFGTEASKFRDDNDEYPIMVRYTEDQRMNLDALNNLKFTYRDMNMGGMIRNVPLSSFADIYYGKSYGGVKRKQQKRIITLESNVHPDYNPNEVAAWVTVHVERWKLDHKIPGVEIKMGGQAEEQAATASFLGWALMTSIGLIVVILVTQFNSVGKPLIILSEILFSVIGVFLGLAIFGGNISILMTGVGIVALAGIVVRNGILIVEFTEILKERGMNSFDAIVEAGKTRMTPVLLTATATILGLIPLAVGLNIDFYTLIAEGNPHLFFGGDSVAFWGPLSWTMIYGLGFATILTLIVLPVMYLLSERFGKFIGRIFGSDKSIASHEDDSHGDPETKNGVVTN